MFLKPKITLACLLLSGTALSPSVGVAETTLRALDGSFEMMGKSVTFDESSYFLDTPQGELIVQREFVTCSGDGCPQDDTAAPVDETVKLASLDGSFEISGRLIEVTASDFVVQTGNGSVSVQREFVICEGASCPASEVDRAEFSVAVADALGAELLSKIITDFAESKDFDVTLSIGEDDQISAIFVGDERGQGVANITISQLSGAEAIDAVLTGQAAFALTQDVVEAASQEGDADVPTALTETTVGLDGVSFVINPINRINVLGIEDLQAVITGQITNWSQLGGADAPIALHGMPEGSGVTRQLRSRLLGGETVSTATTVHETASALNAAVQADPFAFGVVYRSQVANTKPLDLVSSCNVHFDDSDFSIQTEEYPLTVRWNSYTSAAIETPEFARNIGEFIVTDFGQRSIASQGLVAQELRVLPIKDQGARILTSVLSTEVSATGFEITRRYLEETSTAERLSTALRFVTGSSALDQKAVDDVRRISSVIRSNAYEGYEVLVFGFTDTVGTINNNVALATRRASAVRDILLNENVGFLDEDAVSIFGVGPISPVDCNVDDAGRELNRRVEIWLRPKA